MSSYNGFHHRASSATTLQLLANFSGRRLAAHHPAFELPQDLTAATAARTSRTATDIYIYVYVYVYIPMYIYIYIYIFYLVI